MRRKVIQDFANVFCQRYLQLPSGYDLASFAHYGSGTYELDILSGECAFNGQTIPKLKTCDVYKEWLLKQLNQHLISPDGIEAANLKVEVEISQVRVWQSYGHEYATAHFAFDCQSEIRTDERSYISRMSGQQLWAFDWYYNQLYGSVLQLAG
jgi:hypothetical protein